MSDKILRSLGSDPLTGLEELISLIGKGIQKFSSKLSNPDRKEVATKLELLKKAALSRGRTDIGEEEEEED